MNGSGTLENVFVYCTVKDLVADVNDPNPGYYSTSILFNKGKWYLTADKVIVEYKEPLTENNGWGYAVGFPDNVGEFDSFYVVGADQYYGQIGPYSEQATNTACYENRIDFVAANNNLTAWDGTDFWTVVDGFPVPTRLVGVDLDQPVDGSGETVTLEGSQYVGTANSGETFTVDLSELKDRVASLALADVTVNGTSFATKSYADGILTLDRASVADVTDAAVIVITFENNDEKLTVHANVEICTMTISTAEDLQAFPAVMKEQPTGRYILTNDIDMKGVAYSNNATVPFAGTFDGQGYSIFNMCSKTSAEDSTGGFFGELFGTNGNGVEVEGAVLKNISFVNATVWGRGSFLAMKGQGALENVYFRANIQDLFAHVGDANPWYHSTSVLFNVAYWDIELKNVIVEYAEPLTNNNGWGYALGQIYGGNQESNFFVVGADNYYSQGVEPHYATLEATCYASRDDLKAKAPDLSAFENGFWTVVDGYPVPKKLADQ